MSMSLCYCDNSRSLLYCCIISRRSIQFTVRRVRAMLQATLAQGSASCWLSFLCWGSCLHEEEVLLLNKRVKQGRIKPLL